MASRDPNRADTNDLPSTESGVGLWTCELWSDYRTCCKEWFKLRGLTEPANRQCRNDVWLQSVHHIDRPRIRQLIDELHSGKITQLNERYQVLDAHGHWQWDSDTSRTLALVNSVKTDAYFRRRYLLARCVGRTYKNPNYVFSKWNNPKPAESQGLLEVIKTLSVALESAGQGVWHVDERAGGVSSNNSIWRTMRGHPATSDITSAT